MLVGAAMKKALVVEDDPDIVELIEHYLRAEGFEVEALGDGRQALERLRGGGGHDVVILDLQLPGLDGLSLCAELRRDKRTRSLPVIMLTARGDETDRVVGLEVGADDYVVKPFSPKELVARVRALMRRTGRQEDEEAPLVLGALEIDGARHTVRWEGQPVHLTAKEFALLLALVEARGRVLSRQALLERVWGYSYAEGTRTVDVHVRRLREKLPGIAGRLITVKSLGYRVSREGDDQ
jgi:two-component system, OmpR family, alkaline phosphatase synthesis response regulator PhoP